MANRKENPRYHVISFRVSDRELEAMKEMTLAYQVNMGGLVRRMLKLKPPNA